MWPKLTNIDDNIVRKIKSYSDSQNTSKLSAWIRIFSGAVVNGQNGLILESNTDLKLFKAAGDESPSIYGDVNSSGVLGYDWGGKTPVTSDVGRNFRPSPVVTSFSVKEGKDQISRQATLQLKVFSLEQMEKLQSYLLEPGYSLFIEWGWNTDDGVRNITLKNDASDALVKEIANKSLSWKSLSEKRKNSNGEYDCFLGFIVGGTISGEDENFTISVTLRGAPSLPTYLQSHQGNVQLDPSGSVAESRKVKKTFGPADFEEPNATYPGRRRFAKMFNDLPAFRQTEDVKSLVDKAFYDQFINFDEVVRKQILEGLNQPGYAFWRSDTEVELTVSGSNPISINKENLFSDKRFIRMDLAVKILNKIGALDRYEIGGKEVTFQIDIDNTVIGSFPYQFSTKSDKLIIPGGHPDFFRYYLQVDTVEQLEGGLGNGKLKVNGTVYPAVRDDDGLQSFRPNEDLDKFGYKEESGYYGYLKWLFVNFDMFKTKIEQKNKNIREILLDILNEMSSAVNSYWNFQVVEGEFIKNPEKIGFTTEYNNPDKEDGDIILTVIDENFVGQNPNKTIQSFTHSGRGSVFLEANVDFSLPAEMTNKIVMERLGVSSNPDQKQIAVNDYSFFNAQTDLFLKAVTPSGFGEDNSKTPNTPPPAASEVKATEKENLENQIRDNSAKIEKAREDRKKWIDEVYSKYTYGQQQQDIRTRGSKPNHPVTVADKTIADLSKENANLRSQVNTKNKEIKDAKKAEEDAKIQQLSANLSSYLEKLTVVPLANKGSVGIAKSALLDEKYLRNETYLRSYFAIYNFDDTEYLDKLSRDAFAKKGNASLSHPLPIKYNFKILGNSGIRRGDTFIINGIPKKFQDHGIFQVTQIEHSLEGMQWFTNITGEYRQLQ